MKIVPNIKEIFIYNKIFNAKYRLVKNNFTKDYTIYFKIKSRSNREVVGNYSFDKNRYKEWIENNIAYYITRNEYYEDSTK